MDLKVKKSLKSSKREALIYSVPLRVQADFSVDTG